MSQNHGLSEETVARIPEALSRFTEIDKVILYGSRAKGNDKPGSDIDLTLVGDSLDEKIAGQIDDTLDDLLLPYRFDISIFARLTHAELLDHIRRIGVVFYEKTPAEVNLKKTA